MSVQLSMKLHAASIPRCMLHQPAADALVQQVVLVLTALNQAYKLERMQSHETANRARQEQKCEKAS